MGKGSVAVTRLDDTPSATMLLGDSVTVIVCGAAAACAGAWRKYAPAARARTAANTSKRSVPAQTRGKMPHARSF